MKVRKAFDSALVGVLLLGSGCVREPEASFTPSVVVGKLKPKLRDEIRAILTKECGTPSAPKMLGESNADLTHLRIGASIYARNCRQCHGVPGDGNGPAAAYLLPKPRDYRPGVFKFTSTTYGSKPLREDLVRTVRRGVAGTSMPAFRLMPQDEVDAVIDYVIALTRRGELEAQLSAIAETDDQVDAAALPELISVITNRWNEARGQVVYPTTPMPVFSKEQVAEGKQAFLAKGCTQCHGDDGRGQMKENIGVDSWGNPTKAADLTSGMLRGGTESLDVYRHINAGINGTPMPAFSTVFQQDPETMWKLAAYVLTLSNERRKGAIPEAGLLKPLPGVVEKSAAAKTAVSSKKIESSAETPSEVGTGSE
jgi:mono/diheme cytochrome c family protein